MYSTILFLVATHQLLILRQHFFSQKNCETLRLRDFSFYLSSIFIYDSILIKNYMNANIMNTQIFHFLLWLPTSFVVSQGTETIHLYLENLKIKQLTWIYLCYDLMWHQSQHCLHSYHNSNLVQKWITKCQFWMTILSSFIFFSPSKNKKEGNDIKRLRS